MNEVLKIAKDLINKKLKLCTEPQQNLFNRAFPKGITNLEQAENALRLINRTLEKNNVCK